jgi:hypothetical protein
VPDPYRALVAYRSRDLESLLGDDCQQMKAIDDFECGAQDFQLKGRAFQPLIGI